MTHSPFGFDLHNPYRNLAHNEYREMLDELASPFREDQLELLPRYVGERDAQRRIPKAAIKKCEECGKRHGFPCVHLTYVGHAEVTDRLNEVDPFWNWRPMAENPDGTPMIRDGLLWIWFTVIGKTIPAVGDAQEKTGPNAIKEMIGDAIRNGAMRFGVGSYLWSKSEAAKAKLLAGFEGMTPEEEQGSTPPESNNEPDPTPLKPQLISKEDLVRLRGWCKKAGLSTKAKQEKFCGGPLERLSPGAATELAIALKTIVESKEANDEKEK